MTLYIECKYCSFMTENVKAVFALNTSAAIAGLGYLIGVRFAAIILAGSILSTLIVVPLVAYIGDIPLLGVPACGLFGSYHDIVEQMWRNHREALSLGPALHFRSTSPSSACTEYAAVLNVDGNPHLRSSRIVYYLRLPSCG